MIGLGTDIIEVDRIARVIEKYGQKFLDRHFSPQEQAYCQKYQMNSRHFAGRFAAKEAIVKALGTGISKEIYWTDIEVLNDENGKPYVKLSEKAAKFFNHPTIQISISHCKKYATAVAIKNG